jgi:hypothetical protein
VLANDGAHLLVRETLFVIAEREGRVDARQNRRLPRSALRASFDAEACVGPHEHAVVDDFRLFVVEDGERRGVCAEYSERIMFAPRADSQAVYENEKQGHATDK